MFSYSIFILQFKDLCKAKLVAQSSLVFYQRFPSRPQSVSFSVIFRQVTLPYIFLPFLNLLQPL